MFVGKLADKGSDIPEHFGCCHGKEQAKGVVAQFLNLRLGRVLLRGVVRMRMRHKAPKEIGGGGRPGHGVRQCEADRLGNEWGRDRMQRVPSA